MVETQVHGRHREEGWEFAGDVLLEPGRGSRTRTVEMGNVEGAKQTPKQGIIWKHHSRYGEMEAIG